MVEVVYFRGVRIALKHEIVMEAFLESNYDVTINESGSLLVKGDDSKWVVLASGQWLSCRYIQKTCVLDDVDRMREEEQAKYTIDDWLRIEQGGK